MGGSNAPIRLVARFYKPVAMHLLDTPLAEDQVIEEVDDHHLQLTATVLHTSQLQWWLQSFASEVEVIEPPELREAIAEQAEWLMLKYRGKLRDKSELDMFYVTSGTTGNAAPGQSHETPACWIVRQ